ncbi:hypothetical protein [Paraburkholderia hospita]|uniref:hypothetical protein n=1 Tax=Paraburkholderia hospita TaxID=169430 RepID=UPI0009A7E6F0|nr:hypothetical protein [Paraburkholderia hospita]SKC93223.1 hypothetical protein SAMN05446934_6465 [Paraburkholderia hospita]
MEKTDYAAMLQRPCITPHRVADAIDDRNEGLCLPPLFATFQKLILSAVKERSPVASIVVIGPAGISMAGMNAG